MINESVAEIRPAMGLAGIGYVYGFGLKYYSSTSDNELWRTEIFDR